MSLTTKKTTKKTTLFKKIPRNYRVFDEEEGVLKQEWLPNEEIVALISDCTDVLRADVVDVLDCYIMLLKEALLEGFMVNIPDVGFFGNTYIPKRSGIVANGLRAAGQPWEREEHNAPTFKFYKGFKRAMEERTSQNPYKFAVREEAEELEVIQ